MIEVNAVEVKCNLIGPCMRIYRYTYAILIHKKEQSFQIFRMFFSNPNYFYMCLLVCSVCVQRILHTYFLTCFACMFGSL